MHGAGGDKSYPGCEEAIDSTVCDKDNGLPWNETVPSWARFELEAPETLNTITILNGVGKAGHKIKTFRLQVKTSSNPNSWQRIEKEVTVKRDSGARVAIALGDRYRKFYRTLNNAKKPFNSIFNSKRKSNYSFKVFIHSKKHQNYQHRQAVL